MNIKISTPVYQTESEKKILDALKQVFCIDFKRKKDELCAETTNLEVLAIVKQKIADARIKNTVMYLLEKNREGSDSKLELNKQTLMKGKIHFVEEKYPLGNVTIHFDDVEKAAAYFSS